MPNCLSKQQNTNHHFPLQGERKGVNKYYPPDYDPSKGGLNKFQGTHALRERARKLHLGILIIRFEMPYNIWCEGCKNHIGMGVRYNAEKTKVGMYYSTPVYQFKMKCVYCPTHIIMKTDPGVRSKIHLDISPINCCPFFNFRIQIILLSLEQNVRREDGIPQKMNRFYFIRIIYCYSNILTENVVCRLFQKIKVSARNQ